MNEPVIQANASLVLNGDFSNGYDPWVKGTINPGWINRVGVSYEGKDIYCLTVGNEASVSQIFEAPKDLRADACYVISFLFESWHYAAGRLVISNEGSPELVQEIALPPRNSLGNKTLRADGQPMAFEPVKREVKLTLPLKRSDKVRVSVFSPRSQNTEEIIYITRIKILLHLGPLKLQQLMFDGTPQSPDRLLYLCLGASQVSGKLPHTLSFEPVSGNAWEDTHASLNIDDNPRGAIVATPMLGEDQPLTEQWLLDCPNIGDEGAYEFWLKLLNKYTAEAYTIKASLGHHRLTFGDLLEAAYYLVYEYKQSVRLGVQVVSYYTGEPLAGREVTWRVNGERLEVTLLTDDDGWVYFTFEPPVDGEYVIEASVVSLYYSSGKFTQAFDVRVLATDPLKEVMVIVDGEAARWAEKTGYPNRGDKYPVTLELLADSPLLGTELWLLWEGDSPVELGVTVSPELKKPVPVTVAELIWMLTCDDRLDGKFELLLGCSKLLLPSRKKPMSLARNKVAIGEVRTFNTSPVVDEGGRVLLMVQVLHFRNSSPGDPVVKALVDWAGPNGTVSAVTGGGGWASFFGTPESANPYTITAKVRAHAGMLPIERPFDVTPVASSSWNGKAEFDLDGKSVDLVTVGIACLRGESHTFRVTPMPGSPVAGKIMTLTWIVGSDLGITIGAPTATPDGGWEWLLSSVFGSSLSGLFELLLESEALTEKRVLSGRLLSSNLADEATVLLDQVTATLGNQKLFPCLGALHHFNFLLNALSPLIGLEVVLVWSGTSADELGATVEPALHLPQVISAGGALWVLNFTVSQNHGQFALALALPQLQLTSVANVMQLGHNKVRIDEVHEAAVDPVVGQDRAWLWVQVISSFTRKPVAQVPVKWTAEGASNEVETDASGWSGHAVKPETAKQYEVEALVASLYDGYQDKRAMTVQALASDPLKEVEVSFDRNPPQPLGTRAFFPRRNGEHQMEFTAKAGSALLDQDVMLGLTGTGLAALDLSFSPRLGVAQRFVDGKLNYTLKCGNQIDGSFALRLAASRLQNLSPANAMSLGTGSQVLKIIMNNAVRQTLDWGQVLSQSITLVSAISGKPMAGWTVTWRSPDLGDVTMVSDFYGVARIRFTPKTPGPGELTVTVGDQDHTESASLAFTLNEPRKIIELIEVDTVEKDADQESETRVQAKVVSSRTGEPQEDVEVMWEVGGHALPSSRTDAKGIAVLIFTPTAEGIVVVWATVRGGLAGWYTESLVLVVETFAFEIAELNAPASIGAGSVGNADAVVVDRITGQPVKNVIVLWSFAGKPLAPTTTDDDGRTSNTFSTLLLGRQKLTAKVEDSTGSSAKKERDVIVTWTE